jgi:PKD domain
VRKTHNRHSGSRIAKLGATILFAYAHCLFAQATLKVSVDQKSGAYSITRVDATISVTLPPHSVRVLKLVRSDTPAVPPALGATVPPTGNAGDMLRFSARPASEAAPILEYTWDFGDGTSVSGANVAHAFTHAGTYQVRVLASGLAASSSDQSKSLTIHGAVFTKYAPGAKRRLEATTP